MKVRIAFVAMLILICYACGSSQAPVPPTSFAPFQTKACQVDSTYYAHSCSFDASTQPGDMLVVSAGMGCSSALQTCNTASDSQGNVWQLAHCTPYWNGFCLWYALNVKGGADTIYFPSGSGQVPLMAEYPPSQGLDGASDGTYAKNNLPPIPQGGSSDIGWTIPIETSQPCELLVVWSTAGSLEYNMTIDHFPNPGPNFTVRISSYGGLALEDETTTTPGLYIGTMGWNTYAHWLMGSAAFKMGGCK